MAESLTTAQESTRRALLAGTAIALQVRTARADFMLSVEDMLIALSHAAAEVLAEQVDPAVLMSVAMSREDHFVQSFRNQYRARVGAYRIRREG